MTAITRTKPGLELVQDIHKIAFGKEDPSLNEVCIDNKCVDATEVTESAYAAVMGKSPSSNGPQMPVTLVSYNDAAAFCKKKGKFEHRATRLPTGAEWEKFAGPNEFATADGKLVDANGKKEANFDSNGPQNVASYLPNGNGMYDMTGNVLEWVSDGDVLFKDLHGGCWNDSVRDFLRVADRCGNYPSHGYSTVGFRCVAPEDSKK